MARKYSSKETKGLIERHKDNLKRLNAALSLPQEFGAKLRACVNRLYTAGVFSADVMASLTGRDTDEDSIGEFIRLLYLEKRAERQADVCRGILTENGGRITGLIKEASAGANAVSWLFSSSKKKQDSENAYEMLNSEAGQGYYWTSSQRVLSSVAENSRVTAADAWDDARHDLREYRDILSDNMPRELASARLIPVFDYLIEKFGITASALEREKAKTDAIGGNIRTAAERMAMANVMEILKTVPVEELNRRKKGIRVKALRDAGFTTMADLYAASPYQLAAVYGISEDASYLIKSITKDFAAEARQNVKLKLSADNKTKEATRLITELFRYRKYSGALKEAAKFSADYDDRVENAIAALRSVGCGAYWRFFDYGEKNSVKRSFTYLSGEIDGEYSRRANEIVRLFRAVDASGSGDAWEDFRNNSVSYFNILEELVPGVLGNDDKLYGLPEELAREIQEECFFPDGLNCELRRYQEWGVKYILHQERVLLGDEMGLGKTIQAIATMVSLKNTGASHFIVVCPASVLPNWCKEIAAKSKLRVTKVHGSGRNQALMSWIKTGGVAVTTYETTGIFRFDEGFRYDLLVVDEAHFIKNVNANRSKNVRELAGFTGRILFMTGTALENRVDEMISLIEVLQPHVADGIKDIAFMSAAPQFRERVAGVYYRRKREDVLTELPDLIESREWCTMSPEEERLYELDVLSRNFMATRRLSWNVDRLDQSCKARRMLEIIEEAEDDGRKVLIFSFFLDTIRKIHAYLGDRCCNPINGSLQPQRRQEIIDEFNSDPGKTVLCAQIQSGGTGLNIQAASVVIICEPQFKPSIENQAISRAYRMGQTRNVLVYRLLCEDTVDERITELLEQKQAIFDAFADKSVAAEKTEGEVDETTFGKIIEEEIERIKAKDGNTSQKSGKASV